MVLLIDFRIKLYSERASHVSSELRGKSRKYDTICSPALTKDAHSWHNDSAMAWLPPGSKGALKEINSVAVCPCLEA